MRPISVYIHIPLCVRKCAYCDFVSYPGRAGRAGEYVEAVCREARAQAAFFGRRRVETVYIGGGTPSLLNGAQARALLDALRDAFDVSPEAEITMEANPGTLTRAKLDAYREAGVNRLSLGVQSFDGALLRAIGRIHTAAQAEEAVRLARGAGFGNVNLDLMCGLPGQTPTQWEETLARALSLSPEHLSCYALILEEGTPLYEEARAGRCAPLPDEDALLRMDEATDRLTRGAGLSRYEVSNWARPGRECRHNLVYWECLPYLGLGCAAHSDMDGRRFYNPSGFEEYLSLAASGASRPAEGRGDARERRFERMMMGLRMTRGVDAPRFERDFGLPPEAVWPRAIARMTAGGLMRRDADRLALTPRGMDVMNALLVELMEEQEGA